ncbi:MAG: phage tail protein [Anaerolineales bacterium]|nr:phage tail protein [Anaerolineales bacterium]MCB9128389.1 phage tail protein [Ardenticatenales bacterium]
MSDRYDPSPTFRFRVEISGVTVSRFSEVSGLEVQQQTEDYAEGGQNSHLHRLPTRFKYSDLILKRGIAEDGKPLWEWLEKALSGEITPHDVTVNLYDAEGKSALRTWNFADAYPIKWSATALAAETSAIAIETLSLAHQGLRLPST